MRERHSEDGLWDNNWPGHSTKSPWDKQIVELLRGPLAKLATENRSLRLCWGTEPQGLGGLQVTTPPVVASLLGTFSTPPADEVLLSGITSLALVCF